MHIITQLISLIVFAYLAIFAFYYLVFALGALFYREPRSNKSGNKSTCVVFIPAYKEDMVIVDVAQAAANHQSIHCTFDVVVIADSLQEATMTKLAELPITLIDVHFEKSTKSKALNKAINTLEKNYNYAIVLDADNIMAAGFIDEIHARLQLGFKIVQGHRQDKNRNTRFAILDAVSEGVNNSIFRKGHRVFGLSAALIGSGFAAEYPLFVSMMREIQAIGGFDKEMEIKALKLGIRIGFADKAIVYDEKVQQADVFVQQRRRWLSAQFIYFSRYFVTACNELVTHGNIDLFDKVVQMVSPPRVLLLGSASMLAAMMCLLQMIQGATAWVLPACIYWVALFSVSLLAILMATPRKFYAWNTAKAVLSLPKAFVLMFLTLFKLKGANKKFIHTKHSQH